MPNEIKNFITLSYTDNRGIIIQHEMTLYVDNKGEISSLCIKREDTNRLSGDFLITITNIGNGKFEIIDSGLDKVFEKDAGDIMPIVFEHLKGDVFVKGRGELNGEEADCLKAEFLSNVSAAILVGNKSVEIDKVRINDLMTLEAGISEAEAKFILTLKDQFINPDDQTKEQIRQVLTMLKDIDVKTEEDFKSVIQNPVFNNVREIFGFNK